LIDPSVDYAKKICEEKNELKLEMAVEQINIVNQIKNLLTYPFVKERFEDGKLNIYGWYYVIDTGDIYNYDMEDGTFKLIT